MRLIPERSLIAVAATAAFLSGGANAHAGPCAAQIAQLQKIAQSKTPTLPQTSGSQLHHQPTVADVENAQDQAKAAATAALDRARKADAQGDAAACTNALAEFKKLYAIS